MLGKIALKYYNNGLNCSQCIIKAVGEFYNINIDKQSFRMLSAVSNGFGIGSLCSVIAAGVMVFGLMFDENTAKRLRIRLLAKWEEAFGSANCSNIKASPACKNGCERAVYYGGELIESLINSTLQKNT